MANPYYGEISVTRVSKMFYHNSYFDYADKNDFYKYVMGRIPQICLHDFVPGTVQKIAFDQFKNNKLVLVYRILKDHGYIYRVRIYDLLGLQCKAPDSEQEDGINSHDDIDDLFDEARSQE
jgi:hypothetical protein